MLGALKHTALCLVKGLVLRDRCMLFLQADKAEEASDAAEELPAPSLVPKPARPSVGESPGTNQLVKEVEPAQG
jgi:hypothetical protein